MANAERTNTLGALLYSEINRFYYSFLVHVRRSERRESDGSMCAIPSMSHEIRPLEAMALVNAQ